MTKSKYRKRKNLEFRTKGYATADKILSEADKGFLFEAENRTALLRHCHKNIVLYPGEIQEGDTVCLMKVRPEKARRRKRKFSTWKVQYFDRGNGFIQLGNSDTFNKEGAKENISFIRSHNFNITDVWNLETVFTLFFLPRLKVFINSTRYGTPANIYQQYIDDGYTQEEASKEAEKQWNWILKRMYEGLVLHAEAPEAEDLRKQLIQELGLKNQKELWEVENQMEKDAMDLFSKYFFSLWD